MTQLKAKKEKELSGGMTCKTAGVNTDKGDDILLNWMSMNVLLHGKTSVRVASVGIMCTSRQDIQTAL